MKEIMEKSERISMIMKCFSNKDKLAILCFLSKDVKNVSQILKCSRISQSQLSQYLWKMKLEWILESEKKWKEVFYKIKDQKVFELIRVMKEIFSK